MVVPTTATFTSGSPEVAFFCFDSAHEAELLAADTNDVIAAICQLDFATAACGGADLIVLASEEAFEGVVVVCPVGQRCAGVLRGDE